MFFLRYILFLLFSVTAVFSMPPSGTLISNTARIEYEDETGFKYKDFSNTVTVRVKQVFGIDITPDYQKLVSPPNSQVYIPFVLKNTGNGRDRYIISVKNLLNDDTDLKNIKVYVDKNENGILDPGEQEYNNSNPPYIESNGYIPLLVVGKTEVNGSAKIKLEGFSSGNEDVSDKENTAEILIRSDISLKAKKSANRLEVSPGENFSFSIDITNTGTEEENGTDVHTDFNNDEDPEVIKGILIEDQIPPYTEYISATYAPVDSTLLFKGDRDYYWKDSINKIKGSLKKIGLLVYSLSPDQQAKLKVDLSVDNDAPYENLENTSYVYTSLGKIPSNTVIVKIKEKTDIVIDDTDDNDAYTGSNRYQDNDDSMVVYSMTSGKGMYVDFINEAWNLGNRQQVINIKWDKGSSKNIDESVMKVVFLDVQGNPLTDTNNDGEVDVGYVKPKQRVKFITRVYILKRSFKDVVIAVKGFSQDGKNTDFTFDIIKDVQPVTALVKVYTVVKTALKTEPLRKRKIAVFVFDENEKPLSDRPITLWTDYNGYILYDNDGNIKTLYNIMEDGKKYRITVEGEYKNFSYLLSPPVEKRYFDEVANTGDEKCWDRSGKEVDCDPNRKDIVGVRVLDNGTKELILPLDPAGYVYDAITNEKLNNVCVYFYKCSDETCNSYILVDNDLLDYHSNISAGRQTNPQLTSSNYGVGTGNGTFEFIFKNFVPSLRGWYFLEADFNCSGANTSLKDKYFPIKLKKTEIWVPAEGKPYTGEKFYIDEDFPGAMLMRLPLGKAVAGNLVVKKDVYPSIASIGDFVRWKITVENKGDAPVYYVNVYDYLPRGFRYKRGSTEIDGVHSSDPEISKDGRILTWTIDNIPEKSAKTIEFYTAVIPSISEGRKKNISDARGWLDTSKTTEVKSNKAFAYIRVTKGIFTDKGYIFGKVFIDENKNGIHDENEPVIKGAKIYLDNGRYTVTDIEGKYHFDNLNPRTYVVKIDKTSIPKGARLLTTGSRNAGDPGTVFADVYPGEMHKVNFALAPFNPHMEIFKTKKKIEGKIRVERGIDDIFVDPIKKNTKIKNYILLKNRSKEPLYEVEYTENSSFIPEKGTSYINGAPFKDPDIKGKSFKWHIPVLLPEEKIKITWISEIPSDEGKTTAKISAKLSPSDRDISIPVNIPVEFKNIKNREFKAVVYFDFGKAELSDKAKKTLEKIISYVKKINYKLLFIEIRGHTDAVRVVNPEIKDNANLSLKRAESVKRFLQKHLIDLKRVKIK